MLAWLPLVTEISTELTLLRGSDGQRPGAGAWGAGVGVCVWGGSVQAYCVSITLDGVDP